MMVAHGEDKTFKLAERQVPDNDHIQAVWELLKMAVPLTILPWKEAPIGDTHYWGKMYMPGWGHFWIQQHLL